MSNPWPPENTVPTDESWHFCDGQYGYEINRVSPEGNVFGQTRWIAEVTHKIWWTGSSYVYVEISGLHMSVDELPSSRPFGEIHRVREYVAATNEYVWTEYWYDSEVGRWKRLEWLWTIDGLFNVPNPGVQVGGAHIVVERCVPFVWTGVQWARFRHSMLKDDEPLRHLPAGFLRTLNPDARVVYYSPTEIGIEAVKGGSGKVLVNLEYVTAQRQASVTPSQAVLDWDEAAGAIVARYIEPETEYWIYLANSDTAFVIEGLPADSSHNAAPAWDYRTKLFLSTTPDFNGYLSDSGSGLNARLVGKIETDNTSAADGGPYFLRELDISLISREVSLPETYREFSDFTVTFYDENTLKLERIDATYGQVYAGGNLHYLGEGRVVETDDAWIDWSDTEPKLTRRTNGLSPSTRYYLYLPGEVDPFNFNAINPDTNRPWQSTDTDAALHYQAVLDMRLKLFLSPKEPDHGCLDEAWPGYYARHVGQVMTDENGKFVNSWDLSAIRQTTLNPSWFDGLAEIEITPVDTSEFRICKKTGGSGIVCVRGSAIQTYESDDALVHTIKTSDLVQAYNEANQSDPLSDLNPISLYPEQTLHVYLANNRDLWSALAGRIFVSNHEPVGGYLSKNWPGNNARWLCSIKPDASGAFDGPFISKTVAVSSHSQLFDDEPEKHRVHNDSVVSNLTLLSAAATLFEVQKIAGLPVKLEFGDSTHISLKPVGGQAANVVLPDLTTKSVPAAGISLSVSGTTYTIYYVYLSASGLELSTTAPDKVCSNLQTSGTAKVLVGWLAFSAPNTLAGAWNVWSFSHDQGEWSVGISETTVLSLPGCVVPPGKTARLRRTGIDGCSTAWAGYGNMEWSMQVIQGNTTAFFTIWITDCHLVVQFTAGAWLSHDVVGPGVYDAFTLTHSIGANKIDGFAALYCAGNYWRSFSGALILTRD